MFLQRCALDVTTYEHVLETSSICSFIEIFYFASGRKMFASSRNKKVWIGKTTENIASVLVEVFSLASTPFENPRNEAWTSNLTQVRGYILDLISSPPRRIIFLRRHVSPDEIRFEPRSTNPANAKRSRWHVSAKNFPPAPSWSV